MTRSKIKNSVKGILAKFLGTDLHKLKNNRVIYEEITNNHDLRQEIMETTTVHFVVTHSTITVGELVSLIEKAWDGKDARGQRIHNVEVSKSE